MAVLAPFISVIIPVRTLEERYPGGVERYQLEHSNPTYCRDEHLTRVGFMSPPDVKSFVDSIAATSSLELRDEKCTSLPWLARYPCTRRVQFLGLLAERS